MDAARINDTCGVLLVVLSLLALATVLNDFRTPKRQRTGKPSPLFEMSVLVMCFVVVGFLVTADWARPVSSSRPLAYCALAMAAAFGAHYWQQHELD